MKDTLKEALKSAMKAKDAVRLSVIRGVLSEVQYEEMQKSIPEASPGDITAVLQRELKKRKEEIEFADKAGRPEAKEKLLQEIEVIQGFLPSQMDADQLKKFFQSLKSSDAGANRGTAMKSLKDSHAGQYDGKLAATVAQEVFG